MSFTIEPSTAKRESLGSYWYYIYKDGRLIARYWHDHRGDDHGIEFTNGTTESWPVGRMTEFIEGGGPKPLVLTEQAVAYLKRKNP
jgi:hypothetical protein